MRPLDHLGVGADSPDYDLYQIDEALYDTLLTRTNNLIDSAYEKFMGEYHLEPKLTKSELENLLERTLTAKNRIIELNGPEIIIKEHDDKIVKIYQSINNKDYAVESDPVYKSYCKNRERREQEWFESQELNNLLKEVQSYNEHQYNKVKERIVENEN